MCHAGRRSATGSRVASCCSTGLDAFGALPRAAPVPGDAAYAARLRGRRVLDTLDELARVFWARRRWQISASDLDQPGHAVGTPLTLDSK